MLGNKTLGVVVVVSLWSKVVLADAPVASASPAPEPPPPAPTAPSTVTPTEPPPPTTDASEAVAPDLDQPVPESKPRVTWKVDSSGEESSPDAAAPQASEEEPPSLPPEATAWRLGGAHFVLSLERTITLLSWKQTSSVAASSGSFGTTEVSASGADLSFLFGGGQRTPSSIPRVAVDGVFDGGFTIGGSVGAVSSTGKNDGNATRNESTLPSIGGALFGCRAGYLAKTGNVGLWLRAGFTYVSASSESETQTVVGSPPTTLKTKVSAWTLTLDPQLVLIAAPRIGITFGPLLDVPVAGTDEAEANGQTVELEHRSSAYGVTSGVAAIF